MAHLMNRKEKSKFEYETLNKKCVKNESYLTHMNFWLRYRIYTTPYSRMIFTQFCFVSRLLNYRGA
jgi:hypothetical protein